VSLSGSSASLSASSSVGSSAGRQVGGQAGREVGRAGRAGPGAVGRVGRSSVGRAGHRRTGSTHGNATGTIFPALRPVSGHALFAMSRHQRCYIKQQPSALVTKTMSLATCCNDAWLPTFQWGNSQGFIDTFRGNYSNLPGLAWPVRFPAGAGQIPGRCQPDSRPVPVRFPAAACRWSPVPLAPTLGRPSSRGSDPSRSGQRGFARRRERRCLL
jgi:hypothetical protein